MMKAILMSIKPKWCEKILSGEKTVEIRKTRPKIATPFKVYIYMTKGLAAYRVIKNGSPYVCMNSGGQCVVAEFTCNCIDYIDKRGFNHNYDYCYLSLNTWGNDDIETEINDIKKSCISKADLNKYGENSGCLYAWHISDLKIYEDPKSIKEFTGIKEIYEGFELRQIERAPQSWCYVEELKA